MSALLNKKAGAGHCVSRSRPAVSRKSVVCCAQQKVCIIFKMGEDCVAVAVRSPDQIIIAKTFVQISPFAGIAQKVASAGAAALLTLGSLSGAAVAGEFDILAEPTPSTHFYIDDANVLSKATRSEVDVKLKTLEVTPLLPAAITPCIPAWGDLLT